MEPTIQGARLHGATVELRRALTPPDAATSPWNVIAYAVELKARGAKLTRANFEQCVRNFERHPRVPIVLDHADTDLGAHPERSRARGWITAMRVGEMERNGKAVATLEAQFTLDEATRTAVNADPPSWAFCSITIVPRYVDEESGAEIGSVLLSLSLTNTPALQGLDRIAASADLGAPATTSPELPGADTNAATDVRETPAQEKRTMSDLMKLAAQHGIAAANEDEAQTKVIALSAEALEVRKVLGTAALADTAARLTALQTEAAKLPGLLTELAALRQDRDAREAEQRAAYIADVMTAEGLPEAVRASLELHAKHDWAGFQKAHPKPARAELAQRRQDPARLERIVARAGARVELSDAAETDAGAIRAMAYSLMSEARKEGHELSFIDAVDSLITVDGVADEAADEGPALQDA